MDSRRRRQYGRLGAAFGTRATTPPPAAGVGWTHWGVTPEAVHSSNSRCQTAQSTSFPRRVFAPGWCPCDRVHPRGSKRGGRSADRRICLLSRVRGASVPALVRRGASLSDEGREPLGAPPWRFSAGGRASISGIASGSVQRAPRSQVVMPGGRCPGPPEPAVTSRSRGTPLPAPPSGSSLENAPHERGWKSISQLRFVVNTKVEM